MTTRKKRKVYALPGDETVLIYLAATFEPAAERGHTFPRAGFGRAPQTKTKPRQEYAATHFPSNRIKEFS
jgi:hypothetical protein